MLNILIDKIPLWVYSDDEVRRDNMHHELEHYASKFLSVIWIISLIVGSTTLLVWVIKLFFRVIGVI